MMLFLVLFLIFNISVFLFYGWDKYQAIKQRVRISEKTLHVLTLLGGGLGAFFGQKVFHHKISKRKFQWMFWVIVTFQCYILFFVFQNYLN